MPAKCDVSELFSLLAGPVLTGLLLGWSASLCACFRPGLLVALLAWRSSRLWAVWLFGPCVLLCNCVGQSSVVAARVSVACWCRGHSLVVPFFGSPCLVSWFACRPVALMVGSPSGSLFVWLLGSARRLRGLVFCCVSLLACWLWCNRLVARLVGFMLRWFLAWFVRRLVRLLVRKPSGSLVVVFLGAACVSRFGCLFTAGACWLVGLRVTGLLQDWSAWCSASCCLGLFAALLAFFFARVWTSWLLGSPVSRSVSLFAARAFWLVGLGVTGLVLAWLAC